MHFPGSAEKMNADVGYRSDPLHQADLQGNWKRETAMAMSLVDMSRQAVTYELNSPISMLSVIEG